MMRISFPGLVTLTIVLLALIFGGTVIVQRLTAQSRLYDYDVTASQPYPLAERAAYVANVELKAGGFEWPELPPDIDTVFLTLEIEPSLRGRWEDPYLEYRGGDKTWNQYFARSARGTRHVDLSPLLRVEQPAPGDHVAMAGHGLHWETGPALISGFRNPDVEGTKTLVLAPHPDDAEIAAFGLYSHADATVVTVTAGDSGARLYRQLFPDSKDHDAIKGRLRVWDSITVPFIGGVPPERAWNLGYFDASLETMYKDPGKAAMATRSGMTDIDVFRAINRVPLARPEVGEPVWADLVADMETLLLEVQPGIIVAPHPFIDAHSDHRFTTIALCEALETVPAPDATLFLYMNWGIYSRNFPHGPRTSLRALPPWFDEPFPFSGVYSHYLSERDSALKAIAMEGMRDIREFDMRPQIPISERASDLTKAAWDELTSAQEYRKGYFRYAARPNEIFFVLPASELPALCEAFLARWREGFFGHYQ